METWIILLKSFLRLWRGWGNAGNLCGNAGGLYSSGGADCPLQSFKNPCFKRHIRFLYMGTEGNPFAFTDVSHLFWPSGCGNTAFWPYKAPYVFFAFIINYAAYFAEFLFSNMVQRKIKVTINNAQFNIVEKRSSYNSHYRLIFIRKEHFHEETPSPNFYNNSRHFNIDSRSASTG